MKHFLAYGNSDQASFRDVLVRGGLDYMTVPGTIAAYYPDATAAFVLSSDLAYIIDPRTPLFQGRILQPKASHVELASQMGPVIEQMLGDGQTAVSFSSAVYTQEIVGDMCRAVTNWQRSYGARADDVAAKMDHYRQLLEEAMGVNVANQVDGRRPPSFILAPYFAASDVSDPWWQRNIWIWQSCLTLDSPTEICPVLAVGGPSLLSSALAHVPSGLADTAFFWVAGFDERKADRASLGMVWDAISGEKKTKLINLYGSFFSICLGKAGLWGFNNGLGYSESRSWPELTSTGAAPARYYLPKLHMYVPPATARLIVESDAFFACGCAVCGAPRRQPTSLSYHELKKHFVLGRIAELNHVASSSGHEIASGLRDSADRFRSNVMPQLPSRVSLDIAFLGRWADVVEDRA